MNKQNKQNGQINRRRFIGITTAAAAYSFMPRFVRGNVYGLGMEKPDSIFGGVKIGAITYSFRSLPGTNAEDTLDYLVQCGLSSCELMSGPIEESAGAPNNMKEIVTWRKTITSMDKFKKIREMYNNAGVDISIVKFGSIGMDRVSSEELEYMFNVAKTMGAKGITTELNETKAKNLGALADKHKIAIGFHNHTQLTPTTYSEGPYFSYGKNIMANLDIGHYAAGTGQSALPLVKELGNQGRLLSIHVKDRTFDGDTVPFGEGDAQIAEILQLIKKKKWDVFCDIELEYPVPEGSDAIIEVRKCVEYCKNVLI
ncbi:MAG: sugar phosphate isomerase/epimerase [Bacteroidetes bacterium]|nr:sugar phosphate isomerase/epimerase [Bacteroidota bacterium]